MTALPEVSGPPDFDAELFLRRTGENVVLDGPRDRSGTPYDGRVRDAAEALVAVGALDAAVGDAVVRAYDRALTLRGRPTLTSFGAPEPSPADAGTAPTPPRVALVDARLAQPWGELHVHRALLTAEATVLSITAREDRPGTLTGGPLPQPPLRDDRGTTTVATVSGGRPHGARLFAAELVASPPLSPTTRWIELGGMRLELRDAGAVATPVLVEDLPATGAGARHLRRCLARTIAPSGPLAVDLATVLTTLSAAGALPDDDPARDEVAAVIAASPLPLPGLGLGGPPRARGAALAALVEPWRSVLAGRARRDGLRGALGLDLRVPDLDVDGSAASFTALVADDDDFSLLGDVIVRGQRPAAGWGFFGAGAAWSWWAEDDNGGHYVGSLGGTVATVPAVRFVPALSRHARSLRVLPTGIRRRAVVTVPLDPLQARASGDEP